MEPPCQLKEHPDNSHDFNNYLKTLTFRSRDADNSLHPAF